MQEGQKHVDSVDPDPDSDLDPQHCSNGKTVKYLETQETLVQYFTKNELSTGKENSHLHTA
jgi:hypothetical protein